MPRFQTTSSDPARPPVRYDVRKAGRPVAHPATRSEPRPGARRGVRRGVRRRVRAFRHALAAATLALVCGTTASAAAAHEFTGGALLVAHPYAAPTPPGVTSAAGYLTITNEGEQDDRLLGGEVAFAAELEVHETTVVDDVARMREKEEGILVEAGQTVVLEPGGTHLMFIGLAAPLVDGERLDGTLRFERAGEIPVVFSVERPGAEEGSMDHEAMGHGAGSETSTDGGETNHGDMDHGGMDHGDVDHGGMGESVTGSEDE